MIQPGSRSLTLLTGLCFWCSSARAQDSAAIRRDHAAHYAFTMDRFTFESGATVPRVTVVYGTYGRLNPARDNVILLPSHYLADHHGYEWLIGPGLALDTARYFWWRRSCSATGIRRHPVTLRAVPRARFRSRPSATTSWRSTGCWWTAGRRPPPGHRRLLDGGRAGLSVGGELPRLQRPHRRDIRHRQVLAAWCCSAGSPDRGDRARPRVQRWGLHRQPRQGVSSSAWSGPAGCTHRNGGAGALAADRPPVHIRLLRDGSEEDFIPGADANDSSFRSIPGSGTMSDDRGSTGRRRALALDPSRVLYMPSETDLYFPWPMHVTRRSSFPASR